MAAIELDHVTKEFAGGVVAVDDVTLTIADGEFMVLVGPSGCGKSTLLRMIAGLEEVTDGAISIGGVDVTDFEPPDRDIAMVFQNYALYPHMNVRENLGFGLSVRRTPKREIASRVQEVAKLLGLEDLLDRKPAYLSGGQRQRVAMGRAIIREPKAFLMDEPLSNLDAKLRVGMRASLAQLHARLGVTSIYVTHDQTEAMTLGPEQRAVAARERQEERPADRGASEHDRVRADDVEQREGGHPGVGEDDHPDGDPREARDDEPAAPLHVRVADRRGEPDDAAHQRVHPEDDHERVQADARPDDDDDAERDGEGAVDPDRPAQLRELRLHGLLCVFQHGAHFLRPPWSVDAGTLRANGPARIGESADSVRKPRIPSSNRARFP